MAQTNLDSVTYALMARYGLSDVCSTALCPIYNLGNQHPCTSLERVAAARRAFKKTDAHAAIHHLKSGKHAPRLTDWQRRSIKAASKGVGDMPVFGGTQDLGVSQAFCWSP